jgi:hypothetical protein
MLRCGFVTLVLAVACSHAYTASAQQPEKESCWECFKRDFRRNAMWPEPFLQPDRDATLAPFAVQIANGWRRQNLLSDFHFNEGTHQLNLAGETKLRYILTQMPPSRRAVYVQQGLAGDVTQARLSSVQRASSRILPEGMMAQIIESNLPNDGWPAEDVDAVTRKYDASRPDPRLPAGGISSGGSGAGGYDNSSIK